MAYRGDLAGNELGAWRLGRGGSEAGPVQNDTHLQDAAPRDLRWGRSPQVSVSASNLTVAERTTANRWLIDYQDQSRLPSRQGPLHNKTYLSHTTKSQRFDQRSGLAISVV